MNSNETPFQVVQERVVRAAGYTGVKKEISVWDAVVHSRRAADQVTDFVGDWVQLYIQGKTSLVMPDPGQ